jgi:ankyrin repeat protein
VRKISCTSGQSYQGHGCSKHGSLNTGADVHTQASSNLREYSGVTALMMSCEHSHYECAVMLLETHIHLLDSCNISGETALILVSASRYKRCVELLIKAGAKTG